MYKKVFFISFLTALLIIALHYFENSFFMGEISTKTYITIIGIIFLGIGALVGIKLARRKTVVKTEIQYIEKEPAINIAENDILTDRENEILVCIIKGYSNKEIADKLFVSENTVKKHLNNIYSKLGVSRRTQAISKAKELGITA
ncbi:MAG TPA: response regulator transcription factor [Ignavibacteria bacterium]|nr:response regulator transcription factor [Ignavibacteria bacterium]